MKTIRIIKATVLLAGLGLLASPPVQADGHCEREAKKFTLLIEVMRGQPVGVTHNGRDAENFKVCLGDSIQWQLKERGDTKFYVKFEQGKVPTTGAAMKPSGGGNILVRIAGGQAKRGSSYKYTIGVDGGGEWDPRVIVDR